MSSSSGAALTGKKRKRLPQATFNSAPKLFDDEEAKKNKSLKNRIRSIERLLKKPDLPKQAVKDKERLLRKLKAELSLGSFEKQEHLMGAKYHAVKFFEKQKLARRIKQVESIVSELQNEERGATGDSSSGNKKPLIAPSTSLDGFPEHLKTLAAEIFSSSPQSSFPSAASSSPAPLSDRLDKARALLRELQLDVLYIKWYPRHLKYVALFPSSAAAAPASSSGAYASAAVKEDGNDASEGDSSASSSSDDGSDSEAESSRPAKRSKNDRDGAPQAGNTDYKGATGREQRKLAKWQAARRWALANAAAGDYLREPPAAPVAGADVGITASVPAPLRPSSSAASSSSSARPVETGDEAAKEGTGDQVRASDVEALIKKRLSSALAFCGNSDSAERGSNRVNKELPPPPEDDDEDKTKASKGKKADGRFAKPDARVSKEQDGDVEDDDDDAKANGSASSSPLADDPFFSAVVPSSIKRTLSKEGSGIPLAQQPAKAKIGAAPTKKPHDTKRKKKAVHETFSSSDEESRSSDGGDTDDSDSSSGTSGGDDEDEGEEGDLAFTSGYKAKKSKDPYADLDLPVFKELPIYDDNTFNSGGAFTGVSRREPGVARVNSGVTGKQTSAARYEREHMGAKRYRDNAANRKPEQEEGGGEGKPGRATDGDDGRFAHLSDRKRRRAERALKWATDKGLGAGGAAGAGQTGPSAGGFVGGRTFAGVSGLSKHGTAYREALFGTSADSGARLKSERFPKSSGSKGTFSHSGGAQGKTAPGSSKQAGGGSRPQGPAKGSKSSGHVKFV